MFYVVGWERCERWERCETEPDNNIVMALVMRSPCVRALLTGECSQVNNGKLAKYEPVALAWWWWWWWFAID